MEDNVMRVETRVIELTRDIRELMEGLHKHPPVRRDLAGTLWLNLRSMQKEAAALEHYLVGRYNLK